uniref:Replication factor A C-terminal domain-containing protein n=1 Tax=Arundo donax TaxID=35708 RepID=A0A0A9DJ53_ARUDO
MVEASKFNRLYLKSTSTTRLYTDLDIAETWQLIDRYSNDETLPKIMEVDKSIQGTIEDQMFYNRRTLRDITEMRHDNPSDQDFLFTSKARIDKLQENAKWWYMSCNFCNKMCDKKDDKYYCNNCDKYPNKTTPRYFIRLQISDHTTTTTCTVFDDEAQRMLNTSISNLLDPLNGNHEEVPKVIKQLCGRTLIFRFKLSNHNLTEGKPGYLVKRTFVPNEKLEIKFLNDGAEKEETVKDSPVTMKSKLAEHAKEDLKDSDDNNMDLSACKRNNSSSRSRPIILDEDSDKDCTEKSTQKEYTTEETPKVERLELDYSHAQKKAFVEQAIKTGIRLGKKIDGKKKNKDNGGQTSRRKVSHRKRKCKYIVMETENSAYQGEHATNSEKIEDDKSDNVTTSEYKINGKKKKHENTDADTIPNKHAHKKNKIHKGRTDH